MTPTSITRWSRTAGAGGTESMRLGIRYWKGQSTKREARKRLWGDRTKASQTFLQALGLSFIVRAVFTDFTRRSLSDSPTAPFTQPECCTL